MILDALTDPRLFGALPAFRDLSTWRSWLAFLRAVYALPMDEADLALFRKHTGRTGPRSGGYAEAVAITGRQSGKSAVAALACAFEAATGSGRGTYALLVAQDERGVKRTLFNYAREPFRSVPVFSRELVRETADTLELASGVSLACYPCRPAAVRGVRASIACVDELAYFITTDGRPTDREMLRALRPCLATTGGKLLILSSPYGQAGALWDLHRQHYGRDDSPTLVWQATAPEMNPTLSADYLQRMEAEDPEAYRSEVLGEFRAGISAFIDPEALQACVAEGVRERAPEKDQKYIAFFDAATGSGRDALALAVAHSEGDGAVLDCVRAWPPPVDPGAAIAEAVQTIRSYGLREVTGDLFGGGRTGRDGGFVHREFEKLGVTYKFSVLDRSGIYMEFLPLLMSRRALLLDLPDLLREARGLERRRGTGGHDRVDHAPRSHDDRINASAGALTLASTRQQQPYMWNWKTGRRVGPLSFVPPSMRSGDPLLWPDEWK